MARTTRRSATAKQHRRAERPLPERPRLHQTPDFVPHVKRLEHPTHEPHYRTTYLADAEARYAYVTLEFDRHYECPGHVFAGLTRFGHAECLYCEVQAWSPAWVAAGIYGLNAALADSPVEIVALDGDVDLSDGTGDWIKATEARYLQRVTSWEF